MVLHINFDLFLEGFSNKSTSKSSNLAKFGRSVFFSLVEMEVFGFYCIVYFIPLHSGLREMKSKPL